MGQVSFFPKRSLFLPHPFDSGVRNFFLTIKDVYSPASSSTIGCSLTTMVSGSSPDSAGIALLLLKQAERKGRPVNRLFVARRLASLEEKI
jgi:hypothetical protein